MFDNDGKPVEGAALVEGVDYKLIPDPKNPNKFKIEFLKDIDYAVKIDYTTKVDGYVDDPTKISNKVTNDTGEDAHSEGTANQEGIVKNIDGSVDYTNREIPWKIDINNAGYMMENWHLTDTLSKGQTFLADSFQIMDKTTKQVVPANQYTLVATADGFTVAFKEPLKSGTDHQYQLTYKSHFETGSIDDGTGHEGDVTFNNGASMDWQDANGGKHHNETDENFDPKPAFKYNGQKSGDYNATSKKITWTVAVNYNQQELKNATIVDPISVKQNYVDGSAHLYEATINKDGSYTLGSEVQNAKITEPTKSKSEVKVNLPEGSHKAYVLVFETSLAGELIDSEQYKNTANFTNDGTSHDLSASVEAQHSGSIIEKTGEQDPDDSTYVKWDLTVNSSGSTLDNVHVKDTPSTNTYVSKEDVVVYGTKVDKDGKIEKDPSRILKEGQDYTLSITTDSTTGQQTIKVDFLNQIKTPYIIEYRGLITSDKANDTVSNHASIVAENNKVIKQETETDTSVIVSGGSAEGSKGSVTLVKQGLEGQKLAGAHLQLWTIGKDGQKDKLVREGDTNAAGQLKLGNLRVQDYLLVETKAPAGYTISDELLKGKKITIQKDTETNTFGIQKITNQPTKVTMHKKGELVNNAGQTVQSALAGAEFEVRDAKNKVVKGYERLVTDKNGQLTIENLKPGRYQLVETKAPAGYVLDATPIRFVVRQKDNGQIPNVDLGDKINYKGAAQLIKKSETGQVLAGAEFKVVDAKGQTVQAGLKSNQQGQVTVENLAPGNYQFVETKAPTGYLLNTKPVSFTIEAKYQGKQTVMANDNFVNYRGSAELVKENKTGQKLAGAEFKVVDAQGKTVQTGLTSNAKGIVKVTDLTPGDYQFIETKAPTGYLLNTDPVDFTIKNQANGKPSVVQVAKAFINYKGAFQIVKIDTSFHTLKGAEFTLYDSQKKPLNKKVISDNLGVVKFTDLAPGTYYYQETKAPKLDGQHDYVVNDSLIKVVIPDKFAGDPQVFKLGYFQNFKGKAAITKIVKDGQVAGAEFELYRIIDGEETLVKKIVVPENGVLNIDNLPVGNYKVIETKAAPGCLLNAQPVYFVVTKNDDQNQVIDNLNFPNYQSVIEGQKVNEHKEGLAGAVYQVFKADQNNQPTGAALEVYDASGQKTTQIKTNKLGKFLFKGLEVGRYVMVETKAPTGYILDTTPKAFTIEAQIGRPDVVNLGSFINYHGNAQLIKTDAKGQKLAGAHFKVIDANGQTVKGLTDIVSDNQGVVKATDLIPGTYSFVETKAPTGYLLNQTPVKFEIKDSAAGKPEVVTASAQFINYQGDAKLIKTDVDGQKLAGAHFKVIDADGQTVKGQSDLVSDHQGLVKATGLAPGTYSFVETKAPTGYVLNTTPVKFEIQASVVGKPAVVTASAHFINYQGSATLIKTDANGQTLAGAHFKVVDNDGQPVNGLSDVISDKQGIVTVQNLAPGKYSFIETKAPTGYVLKTSPVNFEIQASAKGKPTMVNVGRFVNQRVPHKVKPNKPNQPKQSNKTGLLPQTGEDFMKATVWIGLGLIIIGGAVYYYRRKKND